MLKVGKFQKLSFTVIIVFSLLNLDWFGLVYNSILFMYSRPGSACDKMLRKKSCISAEDIHFLQSQSRETPTQGLYIQGVPEKTPVKEKQIAALTGVFLGHLIV